MTAVQIGEVTIEYEVDGRSGGIPMLLLMGMGGQLVAWPDEFVHLLVDKGFRVIRMDNRDIGLSSRTDGPLPTPRDSVRGFVHRRLARADYDLSDMAADAVGLLDHLGIERAHVVGLSMGAMIAQELVIDHPQRVLSLTSIMGTTGSRRHGRVSARLLATIARDLRTPPPTTREEAVDRAVESLRRIGGRSFDQDRTREVVVRSVERSADQRGEARHLQAVHASRDRTRALRRVTVPTLVVHGLADPLVTPGGGLATTRAIPGSRLLAFPEMGHELPLDRLPEIVDAIAANAERAS